MELHTLFGGTCIPDMLIVEQGKPRKIVFFFCVCRLFMSETKRRVGRARSDDKIRSRIDAKT
mgnify:FL=1